MTSSVSSTGTISSAGIGSGLDVETIVTKLMAIEQQPLKLLQNTATTIQTKISAFGGLQSSVSAFRDAALALTNPSTWSGTAGSSSDAGSVGVSSTASAVAGSYAVTVQALATTQSVASTAFPASSSTVGSGTLHINLGQWSAPPASTFTSSGVAGLDIAVTDTDTLASLRDKINAAGAGVSASILTDTSGARLVLSSSTTGAANGFQITAVNGASGNLAALAYDPPNSTGTTLTQSAANAAATINGLAVSSATNSLTDMVQGVTLNLFKVSSTPVQISVAQDTTATKTAIQGFVTAYNALATLLTTDTKYDSGTSTAGVLQGDSTAVTLQRQLRNLLGASSGASTTFTTLSQAGLEIQADGTLKINDAKLTSAMGKLPELKKLFANSDTTNPANDGIVRRLRVLSDSLIDSDGLLTTRTDGLNTSLKTNQKSQDAMNDQLTAIEARMRAQYTALDTKMATLNTLSTYMTQQIANWNKTNASSNN